MSKITGELIYDYIKEASLETGSTEAHSSPEFYLSFKNVDEEYQEGLNRVAKKLNDFLIYGKRPEGK